MSTSARKLTAKPDPASVLTNAVAHAAERLQPVDAGFVQCLQSLTDGIEIDFNAALSVVRT